MGIWFCGAPRIGNLPEAESPRLDEQVHVDSTLIMIVRGGG
jgi:hypothetical protein